MATLTLSIVDPQSDALRIVRIPCTPDAREQYALAWDYARSISEHAFVADFDVEENDNDSARAIINS